MKFPKSQPVRSGSYRRWVATLPCAACGIVGFSQAAHPNHGKGMAMKTSDLLCFPLCSMRPGHQGCHVLHDLCVDMTRDERRAAEEKYIAHTQDAAVKAKRKEIECTN